MTNTVRENGTLDLVMENLALRQQVAAIKKERPRPALDDLDRGFWVALRASWPSWASRYGATITQGEGGRVAKSRRAAPSLRMARCGLDR